MVVTDAGGAKSVFFRSARILSMTVSFSAALIAARTWTSTQGKQIQGQFVRVLVDPTAAAQGGGVVVVLQQGSGTLKVPLTRFSKEDREYVLEQLEARGEHIWTHLNGRLIVAKM